MFIDIGLLVVSVRLCLLVWWIFMLKLMCCLVRWLVICVWLFFVRCCVLFLMLNGTGV